MRTSISAIVPVLDDASVLRALLPALRKAEVDEIVVVDGGSRDGSADVAAAHADLVRVSVPGRAVQMNAGAAVATGECLWFVHADTCLTGAHAGALRAAVEGGAQWGRFDVRLSPARPVLGLVARAMNARSRLTQIATGDQAIFVRRELFETVGGFPAQPLMEDVELSARLRRRAAPVCLQPPVVTSARRWERDGVRRTIVLMWRLRFAYWRGADPAMLHARYYGGGQ